MPANIGSSELNAIPLTIHANKSKVAGTATHIANQDQLSIKKLLVRTRKVSCNPRIERGRGLFQQSDVLQSSLRSSLQRKLSGFLIEAGRNRQHNLLLRQKPAAGMLPRITQVEQILRRR